MKTAQISFKDGVAYSEDFGDIYFSADNPAGESEYVFASAIDEIWDRQDRFIIAEAGFGAGLNFLTTLNKFKDSSKFLHYVSIEANPISKEDLVRIYQKLGVFKELSNELIKSYPPLIQGFHRLNFANSRITLDLCFGKIDQILPELEFRADIWFMDGFAPSKNDSMWSDEVFKGICYLRKTDTILRTYSSARVVKDALAKNNFEVTLLKGFGKKREMISARLMSENGTVKNPWFSRYDTQNNSKKAKTALIIGAGVAGCVSAYKLNELGIKVTLVEKKDKIATNGSGNHAGILMPLITKPEVELGRMHMNAFLQAVRFYKDTMSSSECEFSGVIDYAHEDKLLERLLRWQEFDSQNGVFDINLNSLPYPSAFIKEGAKARPRKMCEVASRCANVLLGYEFESYEILPDGKISAKFKNGKTIISDVLILAIGSDSMEFFANFDMQLSSVRGQVTHIKEAIKTSLPFSAKGYVCPQVDGVQVVGATYDRNLKLDGPRSCDDDKNLADIDEFLFSKEPEVLGSKVGYRSYSGDRFPIVGRLYDEEFYKNSYKALLWTKNKSENLSAKYIPNVYINTAHGSRGLCTAVLAAELICDLMFDRPLCIEKSLFDALHPARFLIRKLKKGIK
ncbi:bifunctional tRNA (5-methylaminomethyl-2-thiouridine)(34)-methyltransferase MnmD/FAD-dependent 5-carboxymethylaminomethyl-2-thiouridine(34) oxidoreductase MnmC [Campylobacter sp. RM16188]|uniref:bifunctional tRNA (5-methylaminomethyl-2-thiouridine)(34)-methyltransferase MnmD/FAD-dependent 5-carboxymethylaminomethyl-2-thiouridine(34) oxidoreductase MnmC n=1 Tax=Campylobacter sp. RM16188 TaxID=1705725 RepID=UPI00155230E6|nr:bifunctional tRNA (5-methylaminomethyl-2-thiouridine)(34)-methyltransferase MnmD/FAD-dependent 5-carboxymethylaminomethyl-2-thiouridine(34) oxidoreductase MnmC [Campylobacter sp. RM16188]